MPLDPEVLLSAKRKANGFTLAVQTLTLWSNVQRDLTAAAGRASASLVAGLQPAVVAFVLRNEATALAASAALTTAKLVPIKASLATWGGLTDEEVQQSHDLLTGLIASVVATPSDGSGLSQLLSTLAATITPPITLY